MIRDNISEETSKVDWARLLLDDSTDDMIITVSREKIAHELIRLKTDNQKLEKLLNNSRSEPNLGLNTSRTVASKRQSQGSNLYQSGT